MGTVERLHSNTTCRARLTPPRHVPGANTPRSVMIAVTSSAGVTSNAGFHTGRLGRRRGVPAPPRDFLAGALLDRNRRAVGRRRIDRRRRAPPRRTARRAPARPAPRRRCRSCWPRRRWPRSGRPRRSRRSRRPGGAGSPPCRRRSRCTGTPARLSSQAVRRLPCSSGRVSSATTATRRPAACERVDRRQRGPDPAGRERAGVAVREDQRVAADQRGAGRADPGAHRAILVPDGAGLVARGRPRGRSARRPRPRGAPSGQRPVQVDRGRPRGAEHLRRRRAPRSSDGGPCRRLSVTPHRRRDADQRRTPHPECADRLGHGVHGVEVEVPFACPAAGSGRGCERPPSGVHAMGCGMVMRQRYRGSGSSVLGLSLSPRRRRGPPFDPCHLHRSSPWPTRPCSSTSTAASPRHGEPPRQAQRAQRRRSSRSWTTSRPASSASRRSARCSSPARGPRPSSRAPTSARSASRARRREPRAPLRASG